jgi:hypothetical protein
MKINIVMKSYTNRAVYENNILHSSDSRYYKSNVTGLYLIRSVY